MFARFVFFIQKRLSAKQFLFFSSVVIGLSCGLAAVVLKLFVHHISQWVLSYSKDYKDFFLFTLLPFIGLLITVLYLRFFVRKKEFVKGSADISYAIAKKSSMLPRSQMFSHIISSAFTIGFGGSVGLESPLVSSGAAIGSNYGSMYKLSYRDKTILLGCGVAASIAGAFNAPIAGVLFSIEVLLAEISVSTFLIPLIVAAASGALLSKILLREGELLSFDMLEPFNYSNTPFYILLGIVAGLVSLYYAHVYTWIENSLHSIRNIYTKVFIGGFFLAIIFILFPPLFGDGYESIKSLASLDINTLVQNSIMESWLTNAWRISIFILLLIFFKVVATAVTIGCGGNGGNFAPSLCVGGYLGFSFSHFVNMMGWGSIPENNFTIVAMAGILSGVFYAPLTAIFLIAEITGGYDLMIPLMIVAAISGVIAKYFKPFSMENKKLVSRMNLSLDSRDNYLLSKLNMVKMIETNFEKIDSEASLGSVVEAISCSKRNLFPVVNSEQDFMGIVLLDNVKEMMFNRELYDTIKVQDIMSMPHAIITPEETLESVLKKFEETNQWNLPVIKNKKYIGFLSKSSILSEYREEIRRSL